MANRPPSRLSAKSHPETGEDFLPREWVAPFLSAPLFQRGWTLQERELSTRVLHFTSTDVIYECRECIRRYELASANDCYLDMPFDHSYQFFAEERGWPYRIFDLEDPRKTFVCVRELRSEMVDWHVVWWRTVGAYSRGRFMDRSDRLRAIGGLADAMQERFGWNYIAGLWKENLALDLEHKRQ
jgi:hypothetical protein